MLLNASVESFQLVNPFDMKYRSLVVLCNLPSCSALLQKSKALHLMLHRNVASPLLVPVTLKRSFHMVLLPKHYTWKDNISWLMGLVQIPTDGMCFPLSRLVMIGCHNITCDTHEIE